MNFGLLVQATAKDASGASGFVGGLGSIGLALIIAALASIFWLWLLIDGATNARLDGTQKIVWMVILFLHFIGALIHFFVGRGGSTTRAAGV